MPRPRKPFLHKETSRHGRTVWDVRNKDIGGKRTRTRGEYGSLEFNRDYDRAVADMFDRPCLAIAPNEAAAKVFDGSPLIDPIEGIKTPKPAKTQGFVTWSDADVRRYYKRWPLGTRERVMNDVYL